MQLVDLFIKILSYESVTPNDADLLDFIRNYMEEYEAVWVNKEGVKNLFLYKKFSEGPHLCFAGHIDVVPPGDGWRSNPFTPVIENGIIYARGAQDMKSGVAAFVQALKKTQKFNGTLSLLLTSDEEGDAKYGTKIMLEHLQSLNFLPNYCIVAEPTCDKVFGDALKIGRRGSINGVVELFGKQGHAAYPEKSNNTIHLIADILPKIAGKNLDEGDEFFAPSKLVITDIRSGLEVTNVTPGKLKMMFNVRNSTKTSLEDIEAFIKEQFASKEFTLLLSQSAKPFVANSSTILVQGLKNAIHKSTGIIPTLSTAGGTSDARFFAEFGVECVEFGVVNDTIHAPNESVPIESVERLCEIFSATITSFDEVDR